MRYDPVTDRFIDYSTKETTTSTTGTININEFPKYTIQHIVEVSNESIEKIADAVVRKVTDCKCVYEPKDEKTCETCEFWKYIAHEWQCETTKCQGYIPKIELQIKRDKLQGEWIDKGSWMDLECSRCKCHSRYVTPFCPQCGARMDGEKQ